MTISIQLEEGENQVPNPGSDSRKRPFSIALAIDNGDFSTHSLECYKNLGSVSSTESERERKKGKHVESCHQGANTNRFSNHYHNHHHQLSTTDPLFTTQGIATSSSSSSTLAHMCSRFPVDWNHGSRTFGY